MYRLKLNPAYCKGCGICIEACPPKVIKPSGCLDAKGHVLPEEGDMKRCSGCRMCELVCPDFAICLTGTQSTEEEK